jgi:DNA integrity scanning protein DisA with diadenylate cyclase activity
MKKVKITLSGSEFRQFIEILKMVQIVEFSYQLEALAINELILHLYLKLLKRLLTVKSIQNTIRLTMSESWAIQHFYTLLPIEPAPYEFALMQRIMGEIDRQTL